jgi:hypothetical protein
MSDFKWTDREKKLARQVFDTALHAELTDLMARCKSDAAAITEPDDLWELEERLSRWRREIDTKYDFRYAQLPLVFARLLREGRIQAEQLAGLGPEKLDLIKRMLQI